MQTYRCIARALSHVRTCTRGSLTRFSCPHTDLWFTPQKNTIYFDIYTILFKPNKEIKKNPNNAKVPLQKQPTIQRIFFYYLAASTCAREINQLTEGAAIRLEGPLDVARDARVLRGHAR